MPVLTGGIGRESSKAQGGARTRILEPCANPHCESGWLHLWRGRSAPVFEGGWTCSSACTEQRVRAAVRREMEGHAGNLAEYRHRMPLGLLMLEQGWIQRAQLRMALDQQKTAGGGRLGQILVRQRVVTEDLVTRALSLQWSCPVLPLPFHDAEALSPLLPRLFIDAFGAVPLRIAAGKLLYLGFEERLDRILALAVQRMSGLKVECGVVAGTEFRQAHGRMLHAVYPPARLLEASSEPNLVRALASVVERVRPAESRLVRVHEFLWLRMWKNKQSMAVPARGEVEDVIGSLAQ
jgi:hypothetical protein